MLVSATANAQPVSYQLQVDVPVGKKSMLEFRAAQAVTALPIDLDRDCGKHFTVDHAALAKGASIRLAIGDGAAGKASRTHLKNGARE